jgi:hypothetical protein
MSATRKGRMRRTRRTRRNARVQNGRSFCDDLLQSFCCYCVHAQHKEEEIGEENEDKVVKNGRDACSTNGR